MGTLCYTLLVVLAASISYYLAEAKHLPDVEFISQLKGEKSSDLQKYVKEIEDSGIQEDYFRQTYENIPIGDPLKVSLSMILHTTTYNGI